MDDKNSMNQSKDEFVGDKDDFIFLESDNKPHSER